jgi:hypothetical protein
MVKYKTKKSDKGRKIPAAVQRRYICKFRIQFFLKKTVFI